MDVAITPALERIARVLAARALSANAQGAEVSASTSVDATWPAHHADAVAIMRTLREPDEAMAAVAIHLSGKPWYWRRWAGKQNL